MLTITLSPELERALTQHAIKKGSTPEQVALDTLRQSLLSLADTPEQHAEWVARLKRIASPAGVSLSEEALSREALYA